MLLDILILEDGTDVLCLNVESKLSMDAVQQYKRQKTTTKLAYMYHSQYNNTTVFRWFIPVVCAIMRITIDIT